MKEIPIPSSENYKNRHKAYDEADIARIKACDKAVDEYKNISRGISCLGSVKISVIIMNDATKNLNDAYAQADKALGNAYLAANQTWPPNKD